MTDHQRDPMMGKNPIRWELPVGCTAIGKVTLCRIAAVQMAILSAIASYDQLSGGTIRCLIREGGAHPWLNHLFLCVILLPYAACLLVSLFFRQVSRKSEGRKTRANKKMFMLFCATCGDDIPDSATLLLTIRMTTSGPGAKTRPLARTDKDSGDPTRPGQLR